MDNRFCFPIRIQLGRQSVLTLWLIGCYTVSGLALFYSLDTTGFLIAGAALLLALFFSLRKQYAIRRLDYLYAPAPNSWAAVDRSGRSYSIAVKGISIFYSVVFLRILIRSSHYYVFAWMEGQRASDRYKLRVLHTLFG